jgi:hypothetical protein
MAATIKRRSLSSREGLSNPPQSEQPQHQVAHCPLEPYEPLDPPSTDTSPVVARLDRVIQYPPISDNFGAGRWERKSRFFAVLCQGRDARDDRDPIPI